MTSQQLSYLQLQEQQRHNLATEQLSEAQRQLANEQALSEEYARQEKEARTRLLDSQNVHEGAKTTSDLVTLGSRILGSVLDWVNPMGSHSPAARLFNLLGGSGKASQAVNDIATLGTQFSLLV